MDSISRPFRFAIPILVLAALVFAGCGPPSQHEILTKAEIAELKRRASADGRSIGQYVAVLVIEDLKRKPVLRSGTRERKTQCYEMTMPMVGGLNRFKVEARAKAEIRSLSGCVARVIVKGLDS